MSKLLYQIIPLILLTISAIYLIKSNLDISEKNLTQNVSKTTFDIAEKNFNFVT